MIQGTGVRGKHYKAMQAGDSYCLGAVQRGNLSLRRVAPPWSAWLVMEPHTPKGPGAKTMLF